MEKHRRGRGSKLVGAVSRAGIEFSVARTWVDGTRDQERYLKNRKQGPKLCPVCNPKAMNLAKDLAVVEQKLLVAFPAIEIEEENDGTITATIETHGIRESLSDEAEGRNS